MNEQMPVVSIIIPTHDRSDSLHRTLNALSQQTLPLNQFEVIVVADGCHDNTMAMLKQYAAPFTLRIIGQSNQGPAATRNRGASYAKGKLLIFIDDDIETIPSFIEAHVRAHQHYPDHVIIGYLPLSIHGNAGLFYHELRIWWENMFHQIRQPGHRYRYSDLLSGNFSVSSEIFQRIGGFNRDLWCHEDYEFGLRLIKSKIPFAFAHDAVGYHHECTDLCRSLVRKYDEGKADVFIGYCHPEMRHTLPLARLRVPVLSIRNLSFDLAFRWPGAGNILDDLLKNMLYFFEMKNHRKFWRRILNYRLAYHYWVGVASALGSKNALIDFLNGVSPQIGKDGAEATIDLSNGIVSAEKCLDRDRPSSASLFYGKHHIGRIPPQPGSERLRGIHLRSILANDLARPFLKTLALEKAIDIDINWL